MMGTIVGISAREILDSRGNPTVETEVFLSDGSFGRASVPSGASTGSREALELRDGDKTRYGGKGVLKAVQNVNERIAAELIGMDVESQAEIDKSMIELDGTPNKSSLGANAILSVSLAVARTAADAHELPLWSYLGGLGHYLIPTPMITLINGGPYSNMPGGLDMQEVMIIPHSAQNFSEAIRVGSEIRSALKNCLKTRGFATSVSDEGGFEPNIKTTREILDILIEATQKAGYEPGADIAFALDVAASDLAKDGRYVFEGEGKSLTSSDLISWYETLCRDYPILSIEDGMGENDWLGWIEMTRRLGGKLQIVGDDIFVTNVEIFSRGIQDGVANAILVKPNQIGTLSEVFDVIQMANLEGYSVVISQRSGETDDPFISDLAVAMRSGQIKAGSVARSERLSKYNQLIRIEEEMGESAHYSGLKRLARADKSFML
ncbi:enolase [Synergistales bacterium]|nr:enolase [Synergistales bacterium]